MQVYTDYVANDKAKMKNKKRKIERLLSSLSIKPLIIDEEIGSTWTELVSSLMPVACLQTTVFPARKRRKASPRVSAVKRNKRPHPTVAFVVENSQPVIVLRQPQLELWQPDDFHALRDNCCSSPDSTFCSGSDSSELMTDCVGACRAGCVCYDDFSVASGRFSNCSESYRTPRWEDIGTSVPSFRDENLNDVYWSGKFRLVTCLRVSRDIR